MNRTTKSIAGIMLAVSAFSFSSCDDESDVIGLNDATKYGFIKVTLEGTDPNGDAFEVSKNYRFAPSGGPDGSSSVYTYSSDGFYRYFEVERYIGPFDEGDQNYADLQLQMDDEIDPVLSYGYFQFETSVTTADKEFFTLYEGFELTTEDVTSYQYNESTGKLSLKFTRNLEGSDTGFPLTVTVNINATVFEDIGQSQDL